MQKIKKGNEKKTCEIIRNKEYWQFDNGAIKLMPEIDKRKLIIKEIHEMLMHRGIEAYITSYENDITCQGLKTGLKYTLKIVRFVW